MKRYSQKELKYSSSSRIRQSEFSDSLACYVDEIEAKKNNLEQSEINKLNKELKEALNFLTNVKDGYKLLSNTYPSEHINRNNRQNMIFVLKNFSKKPDFFNLTKKETIIVNAILVSYGVEKITKEEVVF